MRFAMLVAAFVAACFSVPATAQNLITVAFSGTVTGTQSLFDPTAPSCNGGSARNPQCYSITPFTASVGNQVSFFDNVAVIPFTVGNSRSIGEYTGTLIRQIVNGQAQYTGINLTFFRDQAGCCFTQFGSAPTFNATVIAVNGAAVPEPATWGLLILGLGGIGATLRRPALRRQAA